MIRFKLYYDKDAEQIWLNDMCRQGWAMVSFCLGIYTFIPCQSGEFIYQIDLLPGSGFQCDAPEGYQEFMEDTGVEVVQRWVRWVYLFFFNDTATTEIYTDPASQAALYRRIRLLFTWVLGLDLCCSASVWGNLDRGGFYVAIAGLYLVIFAVFLRVIWRCTCRIRELGQPVG